MGTDAGGSGKNRGKEMMDEATIKGLPRTFVEVFELVANEEGTGNADLQPGVSLISCDIYAAYRRVVLICFFLYCSTTS